MGLKNVADCGITYIEDLETLKAQLNSARKYLNQKYNIKRVFDRFGEPWTAIFLKINSNVATKGERERKKISSFVKSIVYYEPIQMFVSLHDLRQLVPEVFDCFHSSPVVDKVLQSLLQILELTTDVKHQHGDETVAASIGHSRTVSRQDLTHADHLENRASVDIEGKIGCIHHGTSCVAPLGLGNHRDSKYDVNGHHSLREYRAPDWYLPDNRGALQHNCPFARSFRRVPILIERLDQLLQRFRKIFHFARHAIYIYRWTYYLIFLSENTIFSDNTFHICTFSVMPNGKGFHEGVCDRDVGGR